MKITYRQKLLGYAKSTKVALIVLDVFSKELVELVKQNKLPNDAYNIFLDLFARAYDQTFPEIEVKIKARNLLSPWITKEVKKLSKRKQKLYEEFLKKRTCKNKEFLK